MQIQKVFTHEMEAVKGAMKRMLNSFRAPVLVSVMLISVLTVSLAEAALISSITIQSSGRIGLFQTPITYKSEIRGVFIHENVYSYTHDWNVIAQTLAQYGVNVMFVNDQGGGGRRSDSEISAAITAAQANGLQYHSVSCVLVETGGPPENYAIKYDGSVEFNGYAQCPIKAHDLIIQNTVNYINAHPDVDGIMFDYLRYESQDSCYCTTCKAAFQSWLGEGTITDWTPFYPNGARWNEYAQWRTIPVVQLGKDIASAVKAIKPSLTVSMVPWTLFSDSSTYWIRYKGQDVGTLIKDGVLDFVAPMMYTGTIYGTGETLENEIPTNLKYMTAGPQGKIPLVAFLDCARGITPQGLKDEIDYVRSMGLDGWILWNYGGPGSGVPNPDVRTFLSIIDMPATFSLHTIEVSHTQTEATISWISDLPATSKVEYNTSPLFTWTHLGRDGVFYWNPTHVQGTIVEDAVATTTHRVTLTNLMPETEYYFRVQSQDPSGNATSKVLTFTTQS